MCRTELTKSVVFPELIELSRDESSGVRLAAFETLVNLLDVFDAGKSHVHTCLLLKAMCFLVLCH